MYQLDVRVVGGGWWVDDVREEWWEGERRVRG